MVFAAGLVATGLQTGWVGVALAWTFASLGVNMATAGLTATIADQVPDHQRGMVSSAIYGPQAIGVVLGLVALTPIHTAGPRYLLLAVAVLVLVWPFGCRLPGAGHRPTGRDVHPRAVLVGCGPSRTSAGPSAAGCWSTSATPSAPATCCSSCATT